jgi:hypothetical protein
MMDRHVRRAIAKSAICAVLIAIFVNSAINLAGIQDTNVNTNDYSSLTSNAENYALPIASALVEDPILTSLEQSQIIENSEIAESLGTQIIDSITSGTFYFGTWEPSLESICEGLSVLRSINAINTLNADRLANFIMAQFDEASCLFIDSSTGFLNYSYNKFKFSSSPIESTAYAIIALDNLNKLDRLSQAQKDQIILNMQASVNRFDGGFCHRIDGVYPRGFENSSIRLSYWMYTALDILQPNSLSPEQLTNLTRFVKNQQYHGVGIYIFDGSFKDSYITAVPSIETCYYAVKLMQKLGSLPSLNLANLRKHIEFLYDSVKGGVYEDYFNSKLTFKAPEYFSTACALAISSVITSVTFDPSKCEATLINNFNMDLGYWRTFFGSNLSLLHTSLFLIVQPFYESGRSFSSIIRNKITAQLQTDFFVTQFNAETGFYQQAIMPLSKKHGSITYLAEKLNFLDAIGRINELTTTQKNTIYQYVKSCAYINASGSAYSFKEFPEFTTSRELIRLSNNMIEFSFTPYNETLLSRFGMGITQTNAALKILSLIGKLGTFHAEYNLNNFATEILACQIKSGTVNAGSFVIHSSHLFGLSVFQYIKEFTQSIHRCSDAVEALTMIDAQLSTSYLSSIDTAKLGAFLTKWQHEDTLIEYFSDIVVEGKEDPRYEIEITDRVLQLDTTLNLGVLDATDKQKILTWISAHEDNCQVNSEYDYFGAYHYITILYELGGDASNPVHLEHYREIFNNYLGSVPASQTITILNRNQIGILSALNNERFSEIKFTSTTGIFAMVAFQPVFEVYVAGIYTLNFGNHLIECRIKSITAVYSNWYFLQESLSGEKYAGTIMENMALIFYPEFTCEIKDTSSSLVLRTFTYTLYATINHVADVHYLVNNRESFKGQNIGFKIGLYLHSTSGAINSPINAPSISITIYDSNNDMIANSITDEKLCTVTETEESGINWVTISINSTGIIGEYSVKIEITHALLTDISTIIDTGDIVPIVYSESQNLYIITLEGKITELTTPTDYSMIAFGAIIAIAGGIMAFAELRRRSTKKIVSSKKGKSDFDDFDDDDEEFDIKKIKRTQKNRKVTLEHDESEKRQAEKTSRQVERTDKKENRNEKVPASKPRTEKPIVITAKEQVPFKDPQMARRVNRLQALRVLKETKEEAVNEEAANIERKAPSIKKPSIKDSLKQKVTQFKQNKAEKHIESIDNEDEDYAPAEQANKKAVKKEPMKEPTKQDILNKFSGHIDVIEKKYSSFSERMKKNYLESKSPYDTEDNDIDTHSELQIFDSIDDEQSRQDARPSQKLAYSAAEGDDERDDEDDIVPQKVTNHYREPMVDKSVVQSKKLGISFTDKELEIYNKGD